MKILHPSVRFPESTPIALAPLPALGGLRLGVLNNQKPNATELLDSIAAELRAAGEIASVRVRTKSPPAPAAPDAIAELTEVSQLAIIGTGD